MTMGVDSVPLLSDWNGEATRGFGVAGERPTPSWEAHRAIAVWRAPELLIITHNVPVSTGALYELRGFGPGTYKDDIQGLPKPTEKWSGQDAPERAQTLIAAVTGEAL